MKRKRHGCYRCQSTYPQQKCRVCSGKVLCQVCTPEANKRPHYNTH